MQLKDSITPSVLIAACGLLQPYAPDLSPRALVRAIKSYQDNDTPATPAGDQIEKPMTRKEVAELLGCTTATVNRYMNIGKLRRIKLSTASVRIDAASVRDLINGVSKTE
jgi:predicted DNA-binding transcriptional regulator AlpA